MKKNKLLIAIGIMVLLAAIVMFLRNKREENQTTRIRIGLLSFGTGAYAQMGIDLQNGALLAKEELNLNATTKGVEIDLLIEDGKGVARDAISGFNKLCLQGISAGIIAGNIQVPPVAPLVIKEKVPTVATIVGTSGFLNNNNPDVYLFRNFVSEKTLARNTAKYALQSLGVRSISMIVVNSELGMESSKSFSEEFAQGGGLIVARETFDDTDADHKPQVLKLISGHPDGVYVIGYGRVYCAIINHLRENGYNGYIFTNDIITGLENIGVVKTFENIYYSSSREPDSEAFRRLKDVYKKRFGKEMSSFAVNGYDAVRIIGDVVLKDNAHTREQIVNALRHRQTFETTFGQAVMSENGDCELPTSIFLMDSVGNHTCLTK